MTIKRTCSAAASLLAALLLLTACENQPAPVTAPETAPPAAAATADQVQKETSTGFYFDTVVTFTLYGGDESLITDLHHLCARYEGLLSKTVENSDVYRINHAQGQPVTVDEETWNILQRAKEISDLTDHDFSISIAPLTAMWDFTGGTEQMPTEEERLAALPLVNDDRIQLGDGFTVTLDPGMEIDLGGIAKGYIADKTAELARSRSSGAILNLGGNVYCTGTKPDGTQFRVGIKDPQNPDTDTVAIVSIGDATVVTSGIYERYFDKDGVRYHHILDPRTGSSAETDLAGVSIIGSSSMDADAFATACIVKGKDEALALLTAQGIDAILIDRENHVTLTPGFEEHVGYQPVK